MEDQRKNAEKLGIRSCSLTAWNRQNDSDLVGKVTRGQFQLVIVTPEFCDASDPDFISISRAPIFRKRLLAVVVDEAHLCQSWNTFRPKYGKLHTLRYLLPDVPYLALSATMTPYVRLYIHQCLRLSINTALLHRKVDRPNIYLSTRLIQHSLSSFQDLKFVLGTKQSGLLSAPSQIAPTIIFIDSRSDAYRCNETFWSWVPREWESKYPLTFCALSTALSTERRTVVLDAVRLGLCRVLFATPVAEVGIDFHDIQRVIQWRIPRTLGASGFYQRVGRAGRKDGSKAVAIL
ncbi:P-loop containing nucleoside triphosphate hydrolase protein, partial [Geopyxis carbonaria]